MGITSTSDIVLYMYTINNYFSSWKEESSEHYMHQWFLLSMWRRVCRSYGSKLYVLKRDLVEALRCNTHIRAPFSSDERCLDKLEPTLGH